MKEGTSECPLSCIKPPQWPFGHVVVGVACGGGGHKIRVLGLPSSLTKKHSARVDEWEEGVGEEMQTGRITRTDKPTRRHRKERGTRRGEEGASKNGTC